MSGSTTRKSYKFVHIIFWVKPLGRPLRENEYLVDL
jgi:hypothetical protein